MWDWLIQIIDYKIPIIRSGVNGLVKVRFGSIFVSLRFPNKRSVERKQFAIARVRENRSSVKFLCSHRVFLHLSKFKSFTLSLSLFFFLFIQWLVCWRNGLTHLVEKFAVVSQQKRVRRIIPQHFLVVRADFHPLAAVSAGDRRTAVESTVSFSEL